MSMILKSGGWAAVGDFLTIERDVVHAGNRVQVVSRTHQTRADGSTRSRRYFELRTADKVIPLPAAVKSVRAAVDCIQSAI